MAWMLPAAIFGSSALGFFGSQSAANTQAGGQIQAAQTQQNMFNTINAQEQPFIQGGYTALNALLYGMGLPGSGTGVGTGTGTAMPTRDQFTTTTQAPTDGFHIFGITPPSNSTVTFDQAGFDRAMAAWNASQHAPTSGPGSVTGGAPQGSVGGGGGALLDGIGGMFGPNGPTANPPIQGVGLGQLVKNFSPTDFLNNLDPGYQFQLQTGGQAIRNADTPGVGALSGPALKDLMNFNQGMASTGYNNAFNRFQTQNNNIFSRLSAIAGLGQNAASNTGTAGTSLGTGIAQAQAAAAGSQAAGIVGATNSIANAGIPLAYLLANNSSGGGGTLGQSANLQATTGQLFGAGT